MLKEKFYNEVLGEVKKELIGSEMSLEELERYLVSKGFYGESDDVDYSEIINYSNISYTFITNEPCEDTHILIEFEVSIESGEDESLDSTIVKINDVFEN